MKGQNEMRMRVRNVMIRNITGNRIQIINKCRRLIGTNVILQIRMRSFIFGRMSKDRR
jgi:hypothetical protein